MRVQDLILLARQLSQFQLRACQNRSARVPNKIFSNTISARADNNQISIDQIEPESIVQRKILSDGVQHYSIVDVNQFYIAIAKPK